MEGKRNSAEASEDFNEPCQQIVFWMRQHPVVINAYQ